MNPIKEEIQNLPYNTHLWALSILIFLFFFISIRFGDLSGFDDAFHAEEAKAILQSGDWLTIRHNGLHNPEFPPLFYWIEAVSMKAMGINDFSAKLPSALFGLGTIIAVYFIAFELYGQVWLALQSMIILATTQYFIKYSMHAMTDVPFAFFFTVSVLFYLKGFRKPWFYLLSGFCVALALLTRPFVGILLVPLFLTHLLWIRRRDLLRSPHVLSGLGIAIVFPLFWYIIQYFLHGSESGMGPAGLMAKQLASGKQPDFEHVLTGLVKYPQLVLKLYWPWLPFMIWGVIKQFRKARRERDIASSLLLAWVAWVFLPFSLGSAKQLRYIMAVFPAFAILAALPIDGWTKERKKACLTGVYGLGCAALLLMTFSPGYLLRAGEMRKLAPIAESHSQPGQRVIFYTGGPYLFNYQNQFLWYANRYTDYLTSPEEVLDRVASDPGVPIIADKESAHQLESKDGAFSVAVLGEAEKFVCIKLTPLRGAPQGNR